MADLPRAFNALVKAIDLLAYRTANHIGTDAVKQVFELTQEALEAMATDQQSVGGEDE